jgi:hypothetical protein
MNTQLGLNARSHKDNVNCTVPMSNISVSACFPFLTSARGDGRVGGTSYLDDAAAPLQPNSLEVRSF